MKGVEERKKSGCFSLKQMRMQMSVLIVPMVTMSSMKPLFVPTEDICEPERPVFVSHMNRSLVSRFWGQNVFPGHISGRQRIEKERKRGRERERRDRRDRRDRREREKSGVCRSVTFESIETQLLLLHLHHHHKLPSSPLSFFPPFKRERESRDRH